jgi:hypothetical protein
MGNLSTTEWLLFQLLRVLEEQKMITILSAVFCLKAFCYHAIVPTPVNLELQSCVRYGQLMAQQFADSRWIVKAYECETGRSV